MEIEYKSDREFELESDDFNLDQIIESTVEWVTNVTPILPLQEEQPTIDHVPSSELKVLLSHLKYQYLGEKEAFPVINSILSYGTIRRGSSCGVEGKLRSHWLDWLI